MIALMLVTASADVRLTPLRACSASVRTALWTSVRARSVCGLNSLFRSAAKSPPSAIDGLCADCVFFLLFGHDAYSPFL